MKEIKEFSKPTWAKLILFFVLVLMGLLQIPYVSGIINIVEIMLFNLLNYSYTYFNIPPIFIQITVFVNSIYQYYLSCLIVYIYDKIEK